LLFKIHVNKIYPSSRGRFPTFTVKTIWIYVNEMIIPYEQLSPEALRGLIEDFVTRDGTDTGYAQKSTENDVEAVKRQLRQGRVVIVFDHKTNTCNIVPAEDLKCVNPVAGPGQKNDI
jgi:uncharacterized protein